MGSSTNKTTTTSSSASPAVTSTVNKLATGLGKLYEPGASLYTAPSANTTGGWAASLGAAGNPDFSSGIGGALSSYGRRAAGAEIGMSDPGYMALRNKLANDVTTSVNGGFNNSGLFGSDSNVKSLTSGLTDSLGALDYRQYSDSLARQSEAANMLPSLFAANQLPASIMQSVGASQDADAAAKEAGKWDYQARATDALTGAAGAAGTKSTTSTPSPPLWQTLLGIGLGAL